MSLRNCSLPAIVFALLAGPTIPITAAAQSDAGPAKVTMRTPWGEQLQQDPSAQAWSEYPRPAMRREQWVNLNGLWNYAVTSKQVRVAPENWEGQIRVPFAIESPLSGVERRFGPDEVLWYRRTMTADKRDDRRYRIHFEAVDYQSTLWVNDQQVGANTGGNLPFSFDITDALRDGENVLTLRVTDATDTGYQLHGKQVLSPEGIWYTPVSGIWQTVWMEEVPDEHLTALKIVSKVDGTVTLQVETNVPSSAPACEAKVSLDGQRVATATGDAGKLTLQVADPQLWSPDSPTLYDLEIRCGEDLVTSYFGLRESGVMRDADGHLRFTLNGEPLFHWGTLDQGWWPDGLLTPPSDEAMVSDIRFLKSAGFNTIRKHIKVEPRRYYYHCDRLGMMVWQDQVSSGTGKSGDGESSSPPWTRIQPDPVDATWPDDAHQQFMAELKTMIDTLHHHPCIVQWVPFNEAWGQHRTMDVGRWTVAYDPTRQVNIASGGNWYPVGHVVDHHQYPHPAFPFELGEGGRFDDFVKVVGEFGGHGFPVSGHVWDPNTRNWGYGDLPESKQEWLDRYRESIRLLAQLRGRGIAAGIYTQTTDVEGEINGLITYDRRVHKISAEQLREIHEAAGLLRPDADDAPSKSDASDARRSGSLSPGVFVNPIAEGADPWVIRDPHVDRYLWCFSDGNRAIAIYTSESLTSLGRKHVVWQAPAEGPYSKEIWAPELHYLDDRWHIYFAASDGRNENHLTYVLRSESKDPLGPYELHGPLATGEGDDGRSPNIWAIDMTVLEVGQRRYALWSGWDAPGTDRQFLYIAPMKSPVELAGPRVRICANDDYPWELTEPGERGRGLNEAPQALKHGERTFVTYSCGASWLPSYKLGLLELVGDDPLDPQSWNKRSRPWFEGTEETFGVGHSCFVRSPDGSQWWHVYHAKRDRSPGWRRVIFVQPMTFSPAGIPRLGSPVAPGTVLPRPSGETVGRLPIPFAASLKSESDLDHWSYFGHHQFITVSAGGLDLGGAPQSPINDYRSGEKIVLDAVVPSDFAAEIIIDFLDDSEARDAGLLFRTSGASIGYDAQRGYFAGLIPRTGLVIFGLTDGRNWTELARAPADFDSAVPQRLGVTAVGDRITISLSGESVLTTTDATYTSGTVGLRVVDTQARFSNLVISPVR